MEEAARRDALAAALRLPLADQVAEGVAWSPLRLDDRSAAGPDREVWTLRAPGALHGGIGVGDAVTVGAPGAAGGLPGRVVAVEGAVAEVRVGPVDEEDEAPSVLAVVRRHDPGWWTRVRGALAAGAAATTPLARALRSRAPLPEPELASVEGLDEALAGLDAAQRRAALAALGPSPLVGLHGPPGTGKTTLLVAVLRGAVARAAEDVRRGAGDPSALPVWALADSNAAADHVAARAASAGLRVVRVGVTARMGSAAAALSEDAAVAAHALARPLALIDRELAARRAERGAEARRARRALLAERARLRDQVRDAVLSGAEVLVMTLGTLLTRGAGLPGGALAVVDEATQALEPLLWAAAARARRMVVVGDPHQLGPVVEARENQQREGLGRSVLARWLDDGAALPMLEVQHRMAAPLHALVQDVYGPRYRPHDAAAVRSLADLGVADGWPAVRWVDTSGWGDGERRDPVTRSLYHPGEEVLVAEAVAALRAAGLAPAQLAVIAPYSAAVARLRALPALSCVEVGTVNAFQGRETEVVVVAWVRSNPEGELGFVADPRRRVVALTRARRALVIVGDASTLASDEGFAALAAHVDAAGGLESAWALAEPP